MEENFLDFLTSLSTVDARQGQTRLVKASAATAYGLTWVFSDAKANVFTYSKGAVIGRIRQTTTVLDKATKKAVAYTAIDLEEPILVDAKKQKYITYLWFKPAEIAFVDTGSLPAATNTTNTKVDLVAIYCNTSSGVKLRPEASTLKKELRVVSYGDVVGYTDKTTQKYLTTTFLKVYDQKGKAVGWVANNYVAYSKPQAKALPKIEPSGESSSAILSEGDDPQANVSDSTGAGMLKVLLYSALTLFLALVGYSIFKVIKDKKKDGNKTKLV